LITGLYSSQAGIGKPDRWIRSPSHVMDIMPTLIAAAWKKWAQRVNVTYKQPKDD